MTTVATTADEILTIRAASEETGISESTLLWWRHVGRGPKTFKVGRRVYIKRGDLQAFLADAYESTAVGGTH